MLPRLLNLEPQNYSIEARSLLSEIFEIKDLDESMNLKNEISNATGIITRLEYIINSDFLTQGSQIKFVATPTTGINHIDEKYLEYLGIELLCLRGEVEFLRSITATAEHTWGLLLALARKIPAAARDVENGNWIRQKFVGKELSGKTIGIVGYGRLGSIVAEYARAFRMTVLAYDTDSNASIPHNESSDLETLLSTSDFISIHIPYSTINDKMFNESIIARIKRGAMLINTSRGEIIDECALVNALESGSLAGAALDVIAYEEPGQNIRSDLLEYAKSHDNLLITPHIGGATFDSMRTTEVFMARKILKFWESYEKI